MRPAPLPSPAPPAPPAPPTDASDAPSPAGLRGAPAVIAVEGLVKDYRALLGLRRHRALHGVSLRLEPGEVLGLIGPNGGGKSTTMKCILGFLRPTAGRVRVFGLEAGAVEARRRTGYLPEESPFPGVLTGASGLDFYGRLAGLDRRARRAEAGRLLERTGLAEAAHRRLATYSKGMLRRFGLAQAMLGAPDLLILDEPTSGLDPVGARELRELVAAERARGASVLLSSHHLSELESLCDRVVLLDHGEVALEGPLAELVGRGEGARGARAGSLEELFFEVLARRRGASLAGASPRCASPAAETPGGRNEAGGSEGEASEVGANEDAANEDAANAREPGSAGPTTGGSCPGAP